MIKMLRKLFLPQKLSIYEEEKVQSPFRTILRNFVTRRLTIVGLSILGFVLLTILILPIFFPTEANFVDSTQVNVRPGFNFRDIPDEMAGNAKLLSVGNNFGIGVCYENKVYIWGNTEHTTRNRDAIREDIPENMGNIVGVSAGLQHVLALNDQGRVFAWGTDFARLGFTTVPPEVQNAFIVQVWAGDDISFAVCDQGNLFVFGNQNIIRVRPSMVAGNVESIVANNQAVIALTRDGQVIVPAPPAYQGTFVPVPEIPEGRRAVAIGTSDWFAAMVLDDGTVIPWGRETQTSPLVRNLLSVPPEIQGRVVDLDGGRGHMVALLDDGSASGWGYNSFRQNNPPNRNNFVYISAGYYNSFALDAQGNVYSWGLRGYLMGTDQLGRDVFSRLVVGGRISMTVGFIAVIISAIIGIILGSVSGYFSGRVDIIIMRFSEVWGSLPFLPLAMILSYILMDRASPFMQLVYMMVLLGLLNWPGMARLSRAQMLAARENEYVLAARAMGVKTWTIIFRHVFPNILTIVSVSIALQMATSMLTESSLSWLGIGIRDRPTWGNMLTDVTGSAGNIRNFWWRWLFPSIYLSIACISLNIIGDGMREAIDPRANSR
jgi:peptide/nickel transport system permease protein